MKGNSPAARRELAALLPYEIACISTITEAEIRYGLAKCSNAQVLTQLIEGFFAKIQILDWGRDEALAYGKLRANQEAMGKTLGNLDLLIAAHAIATGAILVTNDKALMQLPDLPTTLNWASDL